MTADLLPLAVDDVSVSFGGLRALGGVTLEVGPGEIVGLIGSNGAGKTTLMDCISGFVQPDAGSIRAFGHELVGLPPELRPYANVGRSFQDARLYPGLTVDETLLVAFEKQVPVRVLPALLGLPGARRLEREKRQLVDELVGVLGLGAYREKLVSELSTGTRRIVDIATILAQRPRLLLLDEPTSGIAQKETEAFAPLMRRIKDELECSILIIEHDMPLVTALSDRIYALEAGQVIAEGTPDEVTGNDRVIASYLGTDEAAIRRSGALAP